jgi:DNA-binding transcriptional ArsR family regulator
VLASIFESLLDMPRGAPESWYRHVRQQAGDMTETFRPIYRWASRPIFPDFVAPNPIAPRATFAEELLALRRVPTERVRSETRCVFPGELPPAYAGFLRAPEAALEALTDALAEYWSRVFERQWPTMESILEREVLTLGSRMVTDGAGALLARLHPRIMLEDGALRWTSAAMRQEMQLPGNTLLVVPMLSGPDAIMSSIRSGVGAVIAYAAPGTTLFWGLTDASAVDGLAPVVGGTRARVMLALSVPATTADVAHQLHISPALASHHLKALDHKGLVDGVRFGRRIYYRLTARGQRLRDAMQA